MLSLFPRHRAPFLAALALVLAACQDPSGVGLTLIGDETSDPNARLVATDSLFSSERTELTGGFADGSGTPAQGRVLLGAFADALLGDSRATAYIDAREQSGSSAFEERGVAQVQIELVRAQVYGDTTASLPVEIREVTSNWNPEGLPTDTTLSTGELLASDMIGVQDSLVTLDLPQSFIDANDLAIGDSLSGFFESFEGFEIRVPEGVTPGAIVGYNAAASHLIFIGEEYDDDGETTRDTVRFDLVEVFTSLTRGEGSEVADRFVLRDGTPNALGLRFNVEEFADLPVANATIRIPIDRSVAETGDGFVRPLLSSVVLYAVSEEDVRVAVLQVEIGDDEEEIRFRDRDLTTLFQSLLLGRQTISHFEIGAPSSPLGLGILPVRIEEEDTPTPGDLRRPRLSLLTVGTPA